jgi:Asp-tRNA(Asn)/Glu-tRNA(Gln) amidotransferase B subunit
MEKQKPVSYLPDPDIPPVIISQWWMDQIAAKYPDLIHIEETVTEDEDDF